MHPGASAFLEIIITWSKTTSLMPFLLSSLFKKQSVNSTGKAAHLIKQVKRQVDTLVILTKSCRSGAAVRLCEGSEGIIRQGIAGG